MEGGDRALVSELEGRIDDIDQDERFLAGKYADLHDDMHETDSVVQQLCATVHTLVEANTVLMDRVAFLEQLITGGKGGSK